MVDASHATSTATDSGQREKRYFEIRVSDVEIGEDREDRRTREAEEAQRLAFRPVVEDITHAFERSLESRLVAHRYGDAADRRSKEDEDRKAVYSLNSLSEAVNCRDSNSMQRFVEDITQVLADHRKEVQRDTDVRFKGLEDRFSALTSVLTPSSRQRHALAVGRVEWGRSGKTASGSGGFAPEGDGVGGEAGADLLLPRRGGALRALPKRK